MRKEFLLCLILLLAVFAKAQTPNTISFQGNLTTPGTSNPIADGSYSMDFALFDADIAGVSLWSETQPAVTVSEGLINVQLGSVTPLEISDFYQPVYLEITIQSETLSPRIALLAVPYAQTAKAVVGTDSILFRMLDQKAGIVDQTNTALGYFSFTQEQGSGFFNQAIGNSALQQNNGGSQNVAVGSFALENNTTGATNIAIGYNALNANTISSNNVALGPYSLQSNTDGIENVAAGPNALGANTTGNQNIGIGLGALTTNTIGTGNVGVGVDALNLNLDGNENTAVGVFALEKSTGLGNTAIGGNALRPLATGNYNVAIGYNTGSNAVGVEHVNGTYNTLIGTDASVGVDGLNNASAIGFGAVVSQSNSLVLGNADVNVGIGTNTPGEKLSVVGNVHASDSVKADVFAYNTPKTGFSSIHNSAFSIAYNPGNVYYISGNSNGFYRRIYGGVTGDAVILTGTVSLPHGAKITGLRMRMFEQDVGTSTSAQLYRHGVNDQTENLIATTSTTTDSGAQIISTSTVDPQFEVVDNQNWSYYIKLVVHSSVIMYYYSASVSYEIETN
ncbi:MAG: hypothetical protein RLO17_01950 [Cyclobacteriaceae bacterium]